ncbi:energy-coupling factor ABC transporter ATP-binding protein [Lutispora sp.]|jgi:energy-coupling factor transport system ATP-binding protein|uniref:energy-coupling factor ABC transporter ATP-binding protein n=1 Tax=Lutispora sp. TaxID=2828727 RepID=UPI003562BABA
MKAIIEVRNLSFRYTNRDPLILDSIDLDIERGSITSIAGLSGCGKSTLAFCLCGAIPKSMPGIMEGSIMIDGADIKELSLPNLAKKIGMVFQDVDNQLFLPTVESEIAFAPENLCLPYEDIEKIINRVISMLNIGHLRYKNPSHLSGGEKHLAAIASILSLDPDIIILDEVLSELDRENKELIKNVIKILNEAGKTIIIIDHSIKNLMVADTILLMRKGRIEDRIEVDDSHELLYNRLTDFYLQQQQ